MAIEGRRSSSVAGSRTTLSPTAAARKAAANVAKHGVSFEEAATAGTSALLDDVALVMLGSGKSFCIEGHTASTGADAFNTKLSAKRASAVRKALLLRTVPDSRLDVRGFGEQCPIADNESEEGRRKNSRIEIVTTCACE